MNNKAFYSVLALIGVVAVLMILSQRLVILSQRITDPERVNSVAHQIADFDLPLGYQTDYVLDVGNYTIAAYKSNDSRSHLSFVQVPAGVVLDDEVIEGHVYGGWSRKSQDHAVVLSTEQRIVCGQPATLTISERTNGEGHRYRSTYLVFEGETGQAILVINQPVGQWNSELIDAFIASIH